MSESSTDVDDSGSPRYRAEVIDIEASAHKHGVTDDDMLAPRYHWRAFETDDPAVTMYLGPATEAAPLEIGVVDDEEGTAVIHAMPARDKFLTGWWSP